MGFGALRVINDDRVEAGVGFPTHPHGNMEILSYVVEGRLAHKDSMGNGAEIGPGEVQFMSAGRGVTHSEFNAGDGPLRFLQIWVIPRTADREPRYGQTRVDDRAATGWQRIARELGTPEADGAIEIDQALDLYAAKPATGGVLEWSIGDDRYVWLQVVEGRLRSADRQVLEQGDGAYVAEAEVWRFEAIEPSNVLLFDFRKAAPRG